MNPVQVAQAFVERINAADVTGLAALMTEDHRFIDSLGNVVQGREAMRGAWSGYFGMVPNYRLAADQWLRDGPIVVMLGTASGGFRPAGATQSMSSWTTPGAFRAVVRDNLVAEWRVYADNEPIRQLMRSAS